MPKPPRARKNKARNDEYAYDFDKAGQILQAMDFLRQEAVVTHIPEIIDMVDASFRLLLTSYHCILRYEMTKLPPADDMQ
jgi:hypothetical protein